MNPRRVRAFFGSPGTPELVPADLIKAAELGLVRAEEFRKNAVKLVGNSGMTRTIVVKVPMYVVTEVKASVG
jgi:hypothetical protein